MNELTPWTYIREGDLETLPPEDKRVWLAIARRGEGFLITARRDGGRWIAGDYAIQEIDGIPYAWQHFPTPPPLPTVEQEKT